MKTIRVTEPLFLSLLLASACAGTFLGYVLGYRFPFKSDKDWVDAVTALGTVAAVVVALGFGMRSIWKENAERTAQAQLAAAFVERPIAKLRREAEALRTQLFQYYLLPSKAPRNVELAKIFDNELLEAGPEQLKLYYQADPRVGVQVARAVVRLREIKAWVHSTWDEPPAKRTVGWDMFQSVEAQVNANNAIDICLGLEAATNIVYSLIDDVEIPREHLDPDQPNEA